MILKCTCTHMSSISSIPVSHVALPRAKLLSMLTATSVLALLSSSPVLAQTVIDGGQIVTVPGTQPSPWNVGDALTIGSTGNGTLEISNGGRVTSNRTTIGAEIGSVGTASVSGIGSTWEDLSPYGFSVGEKGTGFLTIEDGGKVSSLDGFVGTQAGSTGTVTVTGADSVWNTNGGGLSVGYWGTGFLTISAGGKVLAGSAYLGLRIESESVGTATVTGAGSEWNITGQGYFYVGLYGDGYLTIADGGKVTDKYGVMAFNSGKTGNVIVTGAGSVWENSQYLMVGDAGTGSLIVTDGGTVTSGQGQIGSRASGSGTVLVSGSGSQWINNSLFVGVGGTGSLIVADGGKVTSITTSVGYYAGSTGSIIIGSSPGQTPVAPGTLDTLLVNFRQGSGSVVFNHTATDYVFDATINNGANNAAGSGRGLIGNGLVEAIAGRTILNADHGDFTGTLQASGNGVLQINGDMSGGTANILAGGTLEGNGTVGSTINAGVLAPGASSIGTLTVAGNYTGNNGVLAIETVLGDDNSLTDRLVITGDVFGSTNVVVTNLGGLGAQTVNGIEVVHVTGSSASDAFVLGRPVTAGLYEYTLSQGADQNWYLSSELRQQTTYNPSLGAYLGNQTAATTLFMHTLYDRQGNANNLVSTGGEPRTAWVRVATRHSSGESVKGLMKTRTDQDLIHLGVDVGEWQVQDGNLHVGIMGAYGKSKTRVHQTDTQAKGSLDGYSVGVYGTWFADEAQGNGLYVDGWAQYSWFKNKVTSDSYTRGEEKYDSHLWTVSAEAGYGFMIGKTENTEIMLTPQVQLAYNYYDADDHMGRNDGLRVNDDKASGVVTRVGARLYGRSTSVFTARPYAEANWIYSSAKNTLNFDGETLRDGIPKNRLEAKLGVEGTIAKNWTLWGQAGMQWGKDSYHRYEGQFGLKYIW